MLLDPIMRPFAGAIGDNSILMQDNSCPHTARVCMDYLNWETIEVMDWPACSPDLNPVEHVWDILYRHILHGDHPPKTIQELTNILRHELETVALQTVQNLVRSMPQWCQECCAARGGHTHYWQEKVTDLHMSMTFEIIWHKDGDF